MGAAFSKCWSKYAFLHFGTKTRKKTRKLRQKWAKECVFKFTPKCGQGFIPTKSMFSQINYKTSHLCNFFKSVNLFLPLKTCFFLGIKPSTSIWEQGLKTHCFAQFWFIFLIFLPFFTFFVWKSSIWSAQHNNAGQNIQQDSFKPGFKTPRLFFLY